MSNYQINNTDFDNVDGILLEHLYRIYVPTVENLLILCNVVDYDTYIINCKDSFLGGLDNLSYLFKAESSILESLYLANLIPLSPPPAVNDNISNNLLANLLYVIVANYKIIPYIINNSDYFKSIKKGDANIPNYGKDITKALNTIYSVCDKNINKRK